MLSFLFVYPPSADPTTPPLSLARIKGALENYFPRGNESRFLDENQRFSKYVIDLAVSGALKNWLREAGEQAIPGEFRVKLRKVEKMAENLDEDVLKALGILKIGKLFFDIQKYTIAYGSLVRAFAAYSLPFYPAQVGYATTRLAFDVRKSDEVREALSSYAHNPYLNYFEERVRELEVPDVLGISVVYSSQLVAALTLAREIKKHHTGTVVVLGGPCATVLKQTLECRFSDLIDVVAPGDAEAFFRYVCQDSSAIKERESFITAARAYGLVSMQKRESRPDGNVDFSWAEPDKYLLPEPVICIDITRGCYYGKCAFCAYGYHGRRYSKMEPWEIVSLIKRLKKEIGTNKFFFSVDVVDVKFLDVLASELERAPLGITYCFDARLEKKFADPLFAKRLYSSGCRAISFGMESACQRTLNAMGKGTEAKLFSAILDNLNGHQIHVQLHLIHGFPGEHPEDIQQTIKFLKENEDRITTVGISSFALLKGSEMARNPGRYGITDLYNPGDMSLEYEFQHEHGPDYPGFEEVRKTLFMMFPAVGRLTGSTTDYLLYASRYGPEEIKELLKSGVRMM